MKKLLPIVGLLWAVSASAQFVPGQILTAAELNSQFALYAPLAGATFTGGISATSITGTPISGSSGSFTTMSASGTITLPAGSLPLADLATQAANTIVANGTGSVASPTAISVPSCSTTSSALNWTSGTGLSCNTTINASTLGGATFASPGPVGSTTASTGAFTTLTASSTVSGAGFTSLFASPPAIGSTAASTGAFTTLSASSTVSGTGFTNRFASPGPIGNTAASTGAFTTLSSSGAFTPSSTAGIVGTTTNDSANAGSVGEYSAASVASATPTSITSGTAINLVSLNLTAGDWDVEGSAGLLPAATTVITAFQGSISAASLTPQDTVVGGRFKHTYTATAGAGVEGGTVPVRINLASTTTIYFVVIGNFTTSTCTAYGIIRARRVR